MEVCKSSDQASKNSSVRITDVMVNGNGAFLTLYSAHQNMQKHTKLKGLSGAPDRPFFRQIYKVILIDRGQSI